MGVEVWGNGLRGERQHRSSLSIPAPWNNNSLKYKMRWIKPMELNTQIQDEVDKTQKLNTQIQDMVDKT